MCVQKIRAIHWRGIHARAKAPVPEAHHLNPSLTRSKIPPIHFFRREVPMPNYDFYCHACKKTFSKLLTLAQYEKGKVICPRCGSHKVEQRWAAFSVITSKKSA